MKSIHWTKPSYGVVHVHKVPTGLVRHTMPVPACDLCGKTIRIGDRFHRGPRNLKAVHETCRANLLDRSTNGLGRARGGKTKMHWREVVLDRKGGKIAQATKGAKAKAR